MHKPILRSGYKDTSICFIMHMWPTMGMVWPCKNIMYKNRTKSWAEGYKILFSCSNPPSCYRVYLYKYNWILQMEPLSKKCFHNFIKIKYSTKIRHCFSYNCSSFSLVTVADFKRNNLRMMVHYRFDSYNIHFGL